ncbi:MAG: ribonuclease HII [bacterium]|nr:ribonuclease HII [bacterium]
MRLPRGYSLTRLLTELEPGISFAKTISVCDKELLPYLKAERDRLDKMSYYENFAPGLIAAGADEVGRGPMAGPLVAAAACFADTPWIPGLHDSKKLTSAERQAMIPWIKAKAEAWQIAEISIEELNLGGSIQALSLEAMRRAVKSLGRELSVLLIDGLYTIKELNIPQKAIVKGDDNCVTIAAASILAKEYRDQIMREADNKWPGYGFAENMGYCTKKHMQALRKLGPCEFHRIKYAPIRKLSGNIQGELDL